MADVEALIAENRRLREELEAKTRLANKALASYQQRALQMEIIRQQNDDLDRLASDLARARQLAEERAKDVEAAARLKSEFLANFSHEIRTPLNGIIGYCDLLTREEGSRLTPHGRRDLNVVKANARTLLSLINDILDLSKIEAGRVEVIKEPVELSTMMDECASTVRELLRGKDVQLTVNVMPEARFVFTDGLKLRQIALNLLSNAAKFTDSGEIVLEAHAEGSTLVVTVEDTGTGIPADQVPLIFEKFRQVDGSSTRKVGGTGLGLAIVRELSRLLDGDTEAHSVLGRGSRFIVRLENAIDPQRSRLQTKEQVGEARQLPADVTVLVVDDDIMIQQLLSGALESEGVKVQLAADGVTALRKAKEQPPSAIILDIRLPRLDGWEVLAELKSTPQLANVPVIIVSVEEERARGFSLGACEYLVKPVDPSRLLQVVHKAVQPGSGEVLVADDDPSTRELVTRHLHGAGFTTSEAHDGEEALLRVRVAPPALLILDLVMPTLDGFEVLRKLRADGMELPVVVLTGKQLTRAEEEQLRSGLARVILKGGFAVEQVVAEARRLVVERRAIELARLPRVLYIEDSAQNRDIVRRYLASDFDLIEAEDGEHGLERAVRDAPDLILMDLSLPRIDGWEATRRIKADDRMSTIPVIALTAHASREDQERARKSGCCDYLTKPIDRDTLVSAIRRNLIQQRSKRSHA
jgi:CheY-like chemotaxis protein/signal transduction histidine kinase